MSFTWRVNVVLSLPPALVADRVYVAEEDTAVGVPEIVPVDVSNVRPAGSVGDNAQNVGVPPLKVGVADVIAEPFVNVNGLAPNRSWSSVIDQNRDRCRCTATSIACSNCVRSVGRNRCRRS